MSLHEALAGPATVFLTSDALAVGYDGRSIARAVRRGEWHRVRRGAFVAGPAWEAAGPEERHLILAEAIHRSYGDSVAFSHVTAALLHGVATWGVDLTQVHVTRLDSGAGRTERDVVHHEGTCLAAGDVVRVGGRLVTHPARAVLETGTESALVSLGSVLHRGLAAPGDVQNAYDLMQHWPRTQHLQVAVRTADARAESVGETRARWLFFEQGLPAPQLQHEVYDESGHLIGITDFAWLRHRVLGEFDGKVKYQKLLRPGQRPDEAVFEEKRREDALRRVTRCGMVRLVWADLGPRRLTGDRVRAYLAGG